MDILGVNLKAESSLCASYRPLSVCVCECYVKGVSMDTGASEASFCESTSRRLVQYLSCVVCICTHLCPYLSVSHYVYIIYTYVCVYECMSVCVCVYLGDT